MDVIFMRPIIMPIAQRLKEIRTYHLYTQRYIGDILGVSQSTYAGWECNKRIIPLRHLNKLSNFYELSLDYLLGLTDESKKCKDMDLDINISSINFTKIRKENNLSTREFAKILNIGQTTVMSYENKVYPLSTHACYDLARNFNISVDWLLGKSDKKTL